MAIIRSAPCSNCYDTMYLKCDSQDIRISILSRLWVGCPRNQVQLQQSIHWILETMQSPIQWVPGSVSQGVEQPEHETNHCCTSTYPYTFMACAGIRMHTCIEHAGHHDIKMWPKLCGVRKVFAIKHNELRIMWVYCLLSSPLTNLY